MKIFSYVIVADDGSAPNFNAPCATLAVCKPKIRIGAQPGDIVIGFCGQPLGPEPHAVRWAGVVSEKMTFSEYWNNPSYSGKKPDKTQRPDNIYRPVKAGHEQIENPTHGPGNKSRDLGGRFVLTFKPAWYFGPAAQILPEEFGLRLTGARRGHRVNEINGKTWKKLQKWLDKNCPSIRNCARNRTGRGPSRRPILPSCKRL